MADLPVLRQLPEFTVEDVRHVREYSGGTVGACKVFLNAAKSSFQHTFLIDSESPLVCCGRPRPTFAPTSAGIEVSKRPGQQGL